MGGSASITTQKTETKTEIKLPEVYLYWDLENVALRSNVDNDLEYVQTFLDKRGYAEKGVKVRKSVYYTDKNKPQLSAAKKLVEIGYDLRVTSHTKAEAADKLLVKDIKDMQKKHQNRNYSVENTIVILVSTGHDFFNEIRSLHMTGFICYILRPPLDPGESFPPDLKHLICYWDRSSKSASASTDDVCVSSSNIVKSPENKERKHKRKERYRRCAGPCGKKKPKQSFSRKQWKTKGYAATCRSCKHKQVKPLWNNPPSLQNHTRRKCSSCAQIKSRNEYSRIQWMTKGYTARCSECITA